MHLYQIGKAQNMPVVSSRLVMKNPPNTDLSFWTNFGYSPRNMTFETVIFEVDEVSENEKSWTIKKLKQYQILYKIPDS